MTPTPLLVLMPAGACAVLVRAAYRHARVAPVRRLPREFRLLPYGAVRAAVGVLLLAGVVSFGIRYAAALRDLEDPVAGTAEVVGTECRTCSRPCAPYVVIGYEAEGIVYRTGVRARNSELRGLGVGDTLEVRWEADDPVDVRPAGAS